MSPEAHVTPSPVNPEGKPLKHVPCKHVLCCIFLLIAGILTPLSASGEPVISDISFTHSTNSPSEETVYAASSQQAAVLQSGEVADLRGKGFLDQASGHWIHWTESQGSFEDTQGWVWSGNCWKRDNWECWARTEEQRDGDAIYDTSVAILGHQSYRNRLQYTQSDWEHPKEDPGKGIYHPLTWWNAPDSDQYFYRYYVRYSGPTFKWTNNSFKQFYVHNLFNMCACMWDDIPEGKGPSMYDIQGRDRLFVHLGKRMELDQWYCIELMARKSGGGLELKFWLDGKPCEIYDGNNNLLTSPWMESYREPDGSLRFGPLELGTINCQNWTADQLPVDQSIWFDGFAMSHRRIYPAAVVEIGDNSDYQAATKITQKLIWMKNQEVKFRTDLSGLGDGPYYLWVTNNLGERSNAYCIGGDSDSLQAMPETQLPPEELESTTTMIVEPELTPPQSNAIEIDTQPVDSTFVLFSKRFNSLLYKVSMIISHMSLYEGFF